MPKKPWPTKKSMTQVYELHLWGGTDYDFYSGYGSHEQELIQPYIDVMISLLSSFDKPLTVCDLGCGDFNVAKHLVPYSHTYKAVDIVEELISRNRSQFCSENLEFICLDLAKDELPKGDCAILRHVLQHLSNKEVGLILEKLNQYKSVIITDHIPKGAFEPNIDIISGQGTRLKIKSGLDVEAPLFDFKFREKKHLLSLNDQHGLIRTTLYSM